ncbi:MAG: YdcF family protein [Chloroflexi bacterium]|nr:YdcF family protein [Chloroflexota bacterium]
MVLIAIIFVILAIGLSRLITEAYSLNRIFSVQEAPEVPVGIVFGAGLNKDGTVTAVLRHRVEAAADLYFQGKVQKLLMSGDNRFVDYNEPGAMYRYAVELGVPPEDIVLDYAGRRTYDTCYRARDIFQVKKALLITQRFHLPRALFICGQLGLEAYGVNADQLPYRLASHLIWNLREVPATWVAIWEVLISKPLPVLGDPEPIFIDPETNRD